ncbi:signal peptidase I [Streptomyces sp. UNOC14_S4]|uniref:signal peptidase I n=1 Tax=Streptomyces sp. UNOC14_S4 TaxID=2872340 RepID=UPI001E4D3DF0|nr:signal peptidase I [Streptomyces sp. UNOC14_S4]MCC3766602.1 signal peptidase I [Streptomyces sp. UNOC14_S4]
MSAAGRTDDGHGRAGRVLSGLAVAVGCVLFFGGFVWGAVLYRPYTVPTDSMEPAVARGARVLAERIDGAQVRRGDVVVFKDKVWGDVPMLKRVLGVGGDRVECCDRSGRMTINGRPVEEPYVAAQGPASLRAFSTTVPEGRLFLIGDHRATSLDSRSHLTDASHGAVPRSAVEGRVDAIAWPVGDWRMMDRPGTFTALPGGTSRPGPIGWVLASVAVGAVLVLGGAAYGPVARLFAPKGGTGGRKESGVTAGAGR